MVLFVCSQGRIRSRTAEVLALLGGCAARSCGTDDDAMVPINNALLRAADLIICMERHHAVLVREYMAAEDKSIVSLGLRDVYSPFEPELMRLLVTTVGHQDEAIGKALALGLARLEQQRPAYATYTTETYAGHALAFP